MSDRLPTGNVTLLFTDIEASTRRWEEQQAAMAEALRRHDAVLRSAIESHGGYVFNTGGDAFCATFWTATDGVTAALTAQRALTAEDWSAVGGLKVRMALHSGITDERGGDYFGPTVNRVARLLAIAHGAQVVLSGAIAERLGSRLPGDAELLDLGRHRLKDLTEPEHVWQLLDAGIPATFPPLRSLQTMPNNLPRQHTTLIGRHREISQLTDLLAHNRLVTVVGAGGVGKTRVSLQVGANLLDGSGDGVWFVELAPLASGEYVPTAVAQAMGIDLGGRDRLESLVKAMRSMRALLIFDNCEHLIEPVARASAAILRDCPEVTILASSRQPLEVDGEATFAMPSLAEAPAVALFVERATAVQSRFALRDDNAEIVAAICRRLDGIPLAIELAAARIKILSPQQLHDRLDQRFRLLTGGRRDALPRQQTLMAAIDWSYDLLDEPERRLFRRVGIFANGFDLRGAMAVESPCHPEPVEGLDDLAVLDLLGHLVDKSLILVEPGEEASRYRLLESTRAYAREKLGESREFSSAAAQHLAYLRALFEEADAQRRRTGNAELRSDTLLQELDEVRGALEWAASADPMAGGALLALIDETWSSISLGPEGFAHIERFIALLPNAEPALLARLGLALSRAAWEASPGGMRDAAANAVAFARKANDSDLLARALLAYATACVRSRAFAEADAAASEAQRIAPPEDRSFRRDWLYVKLLSSWLQGDLEAASLANDELRHYIADRLMPVTWTADFAEIEHARGNTEAAAALVEDAMASLRAMRDRFRFVLVLANFCGYLLALDRIEDAKRVGREALHEGRRLDRNGYPITTTLEHLALAFALDGDLDRAAQLAGYTDAAFARIAYAREFTEKTTFDRLQSRLRNGLSAERLAALTAQGAATSAGEAIALAAQT